MKSGIHVYSLRLSCLEYGQICRNGVKRQKMNGDNLMIRDGNVSIPVNKVKYYAKRSNVE